MLITTTDDTHTGMKHMDMAHTDQPIQVEIQLAEEVVAALQSAVVEEVVAQLVEVME